MTNRQTRVLSILATGIAVELILVAAFIIGHGNSERLVSTNNQPFAVANNPSQVNSSTQPGDLEMLDASGAPVSGDDGLTESSEDPFFDPPAGFSEGAPLSDDADAMADAAFGYPVAGSDGEVLTYGGDPNAWDPFAGSEGDAYPAPFTGGDANSGGFGDYGSSDGLSGDDYDGYAGFGGYNGSGLPPNMGPPTMPDEWVDDGLRGDTPTSTTPVTTSPAQTPTGATTGTQPAATKPAATQPAATRTPTKPAATQPAATRTPTQPAATQPAATMPAPTQPAATQPAPTQPAPTQPAATMPAATQPATQPVPTQTPVPATPEPSTLGGLVSAPANSAPVLDGSGGDSAWANAPALTITTRGGANQSATSVTVQSVYDGNSIYLLLRWADPTNSFQFRPWEKQADGSWKILASPGNGDEDIYAEDQLGLTWIDPQQPGQALDLWQWQSVHSTGSGQADDLHQEGGFQPDPFEGGGYQLNASEDQTHPAFMQPGASPDGAPGFIRDAEKQPFDDSLFAAGQRVPSIISAPWQGDRGQIRAQARYENGTWTLELQRALVTGSALDVQLDNLDQTYGFSLTTFDNTWRRGAAQDSITALRFQK